MHSMYCRILLRHDWSYSSNWNVCCWNIFRSWCFLLSSMSCWKILRSRSIDMHVVCDRNLFINDWLQCMHSMYRRILLRHDWSCSPNWDVRCWNIFRSRSIDMYIVCDRNIFINDRL